MLKNYKIKITICNIIPTCGNRRIIWFYNTTMWSEYLQMLMAINKKEGSKR